MWSVLAIACAAVSPACGEGLEPTGRITKARIIGVRSVVQEDPVPLRARTSARPGETVDVTLLVTQPGEGTQNTWAFIVCEPALTTFGVARCQDGEPLALLSSMVPSDAPPSFSFRVPEGTEADLLYVGAVCLGGELSAAMDMSDPSAFANPCADDGVGRLVTGTLQVQADGEPDNHAPRIERVTLRGEAWTDEVPVTEGCRGTDLPTVSRSNGDIVEIEVFASDDSRERGEENAEAEELPVAFFSTERGLSRLYHVIEDRNPHAKANFDTSVITEADAQTIPTEGRVVRFEFVMRDDKGGVDRATRMLCLLP